MRTDKNGGDTTKLYQLYGQVIMFLIGLIILNIGFWLVNWLIGLFSTGITFIVLAIIKVIDDRGGN